MKPKYLVLVYPVKTTSLPHRCLYDSSWGEEKCSKYAGDDFRKHLDSQPPMKRVETVMDEIGVTEREAGRNVLL
jgi:hypothetical protein